MSISGIKSSVDYYANKTGASLKEGVKEVANSYGIREGIGAGAGALSGAYAGSKTISEKATEGMFRSVSIKGGTKAIAKGALAGTGIGSLVAFAPDAYSFGKGFSRGWSAYGQ